MQSYLSWYKKPLTQDGLMPLHSFLLCLIVHSKFAWGDLPPPKHVVILDCVLANVFVMFWWVVLGILHTSCSLIFLCPTSSNCSCLAPTSLRGRFYWLWTVSTVSTAAHIHNAVSHCTKRKQDMSNIYGHHVGHTWVSWSYHDLSFRSWCQALCLGSQAIRINKESNISKSILVQRKTFASETCFFLSFDLSSILSSPSLLVSVYPLLHSFALLSNFPIYRNTTKSLSFFLSRSRKECAFTLAGAVFGREGGRDIAISKGKQKIFKKYLNCF